MTKHLQPLTPYIPKHPRAALGNAIAVVAKPVQRTARKVVRSKKTDCPGCDRRKDAVNKASDAVVDFVQNLIK